MTMKVIQFNDAHIDSNLNIIPGKAPVRPEYAVDAYILHANKTQNKSKEQLLNENYHKVCSGQSHHKN